jgi:hypothetical protein
MFTEHSPGSDIPYRRAALFVPHSGHWRRRVSSTLAARGDYCRVAKKSGADTFPKNKELTQRKPLTETPRHGESFSTGTPTSSSASAPHSDDTAATLPNPVHQNAGPILAIYGFNPNPAFEKSRFVREGRRTVVA